MKIFITLVLLSFATVASAAKLEDVTILDIKFVKDSFQIKLQTKEQAKKDAHFTVDIVKEDEKALEKLAIVLKKQKQKDDFKLNLDILSFSAFPSGSYYKSGSVRFSGAVGDESLKCD